MLTSLTTGGQCNGGGTPVNVTGMSILLCRCHPGFSGGSDFFDTRFVDQDVNDASLSLTCSSSRVGEIIIWSLIFLGVLFRVISVAKLLREKHASFVQRNAAKAQITLRDKYKSFVLRILVFDLAVLTPVTISAAALKVSGQVMGTDIPVTILYPLVPIFFQFENSQLANEEFHAITHFVPKEKREWLLALRGRLEAISWTSYLLGALVPTIAALFLDKTLGPLLNGEFITILVRNLSIVAWSAFASWSNIVVQRRFEELLGSTTTRTKAADTVQKMRNANRNVIRMYFFISLVYLVFCIPQLWAFQTYCYSAIIFVGTFRHPGRAFQSDASILATQRNNTGGESSNNNNGAMTLSPLASNAVLDVQSSFNHVARPSDFGSMLGMRSSDTKL